MASVQVSSKCQRMLHSATGMTNTHGLVHRGSVLQHVRAASCRRQIGTAAPIWTPARLPTKSSCRPIPFSDSLPGPHRPTLCRGGHLTTFCSVTALSSAKGRRMVTNGAQNSSTPAKLSVWGNPYQVHILTPFDPSSWFDNHYNTPGIGRQRRHSQSSVRKSLDGIPGPHLLCRNINQRGAGRGQIDYHADKKS